MAPQWQSTAGMSRLSQIIALLRETPWNPDSLTGLQMSAITEATAAQYLGSLHSFVLWLRDQPRPLPRTPDALLVQFFQSEFETGQPPSTGSKLMASLLHFTPDAGGSIKTNFRQRFGP